MHIQHVAFIKEYLIGNKVQRCLRFRKFGSPNVKGQFLFQFIRKITTQIVCKCDIGKKTNVY